jgi:hypothetical protein
MPFAVLAVAAQLDRNYIREKTLEGQVAAAAKGNHGGRSKVIDDDMLTFAIALKNKGIPVPEIVGKLAIKAGKNAGKHPSVASLYRAPGKMTARYADHDEVFEVGDAFYIPPGHVPVKNEPDTEFLWFSPSEELRTAEAVMMKNMQAMQDGSTS